jgi:uncharacterized membrane protein YozB (DUF420 family)
MLFVHPSLQLLSMVVALYALFWGIQRFRFLHLHTKALFNWKRHVYAGSASLLLWIAGVVGGVSMVYLYWDSFLMTGAHGRTALIMLPLMLFGLISGIYMHRVRKRRTFLPLLHGLNNLVVIILAFSQIRTGWWVLTVYVLGR